MEHPDLILRTADHVRAVLSGEGSGHDWWHTYRVSKTAERIGRAERADLLVVELAALLHDIADWKAHGGDSTVGRQAARNWLVSLGLDGNVVEHVCRIVADISFKGAGVAQPILSLEGKVVQDADRLDAMGAIGIARAFVYGGAKGRLIHDPEVKPEEHQTAEAYIKSTGTTVNHFYEKLLLLKDRMNTATGRVNRSDEQPIRQPRGDSTAGLSSFSRCELSSSRSNYHSDYASYYGPWYCPKRNDGDSFPDRDLRLVPSGAIGDIWRPFNQWRSLILATHSLAESR